MFVVIFTAEEKNFDIEYQETARKMREMATGIYHCQKIDSLFENGKEVTLSYWNNEADIKAWQENREHRQAQEKGKKDWYRSYSVEVAEVKRSYSSSVLDVSE